MREAYIIDIENELRINEMRDSCLYHKEVKDMEKKDIDVKLEQTKRLLDAFA